MFIRLRTYQLVGWLGFSSYTHLMALANMSDWCNQGQIKINRNLQQQTQALAAKECCKLGRLQLQFNYLQPYYAICVDPQLTNASLNYQLRNRNVCQTAHQLYVQLQSQMYQAQHYKHSCQLGQALLSLNDLVTSYPTCFSLLAADQALQEVADDDFAY